MRIISCHIENFGILHDFDVTFTEGIHAVKADNGRGKSTLTAFLRAMFYGLAGERKQSAENERKRYSPWQGGVFGGSIEFESGKGRFTATRVFGDKEAKDVFELRDSVTGTVSDAYSGRLGEELFGIDRDGFTRTLLIGQENRSLKVTDSVTARIAQMLGADGPDAEADFGDMSGFEDALKKINDKANSLTPDRKTGSLSIRKSKIAALERQVALDAGVRDEYERASEQLRSLREESTRNTEALAELERFRKKQQKEQEVLGERSRLEASVNEALTRQAEAMRYFPVRLPYREEIEARLEDCREMERSSERAELMALSAEEEKELNGLRNGEIPEDSPKARAERNLGFEAFQAAEDAARELKTVSKRIVFGTVLAVFGAVAAAAVLCLGLRWEFAAAVAVPATVGLILLIAGALRRAKCLDIMASSKRHEQAVEEHLKQYARDRLEELTSKQKKYDAENDKYDVLAEKMYSWIKGLGIAPRDDLFRQTTGILGAFEECCRVRDSVNAAKEALEAFEREHVSAHDISGSDGRMQRSDCTGAQEKEEMSPERILKRGSELIEEIADTSDRVSELEEKVLQDEKNRSELEELQRLQSEENEQYTLLKLTGQKLKEAREALNLRYMKPLTENFRHYYGVLLEACPDTKKNAPEAFHVDASMKLTVDEQGLRRNIETRSMGLYDLATFAMRLALADAMYCGEEKPVLILDDPFTNLDDDGIMGGFELLREVSRKYEIIYFTCNSARML